MCFHTESIGRTLSTTHFDHTLKLWKSKQVVEYSASDAQINISLYYFDSLLPFSPQLKSKYKCSHASDISYTNNQKQLSHHSK